MTVIRDVCNFIKERTGGKLNVNEHMEAEIRKVHSWQLVHVLSYIKAVHFNLLQASMARGGWGVGWGGGLLIALDSQQNGPSSLRLQYSTPA